MKNISDGQMFWVVKNGSPGTGMNAYKNLTDEQVWQIILYLRTLAN
jgi:mono/diheme cytochrome c family protein